MSTLFLSTKFSNVLAETINSSIVSSESVLNEKYGIITKIKKFIDEYGSEGLKEKTQEILGGAWDTTMSPYGVVRSYSKLFGVEPETVQDKLGTLFNNLSHILIDVLGYVYNLIVHIIIATPSIVFKTTWFAESYMIFAGLSVLLFTLMALWNAGRKTFSLSHTKFKNVIRRYFLAVIGIGFGTFFFQQFFKAIEFIAKLVVSIGYHNITNFSPSSLGIASGLDVVAMALFIVVILGQAVNIFLQNGRRWFQIISIALTMSLTLSAWVFDSTKSIASELKDKFIKLSITQIYQAAMISLMGIFIVGTAGITTFTDFVVKFCMIVGGFSVIGNPPSILTKYIDKNTDDFNNMIKRARQVINLKTNPVYTTSKIIFDKTKILKNKKNNQNK